MFNVFFGTLFAGVKRRRNKEKTKKETAVTSWITIPQLHLSIFVVGNFIGTMKRRAGDDDAHAAEEPTDGNGAEESAVSKSYVSPVKASAAESSHGISPNVTPTQSLLRMYHSPSSASPGGEYSHGKTVVMKVHHLAEFCLVKFQVPKNAIQAFFGAAGGWSKPSLVHTLGHDYYGNQKDARIDFSL
jgi:hypothetical protein